MTNASLRRSLRGLRERLLHEPLEQRQARNALDRRGASSPSPTAWPGSASSSRASVPRPSGRGSMPSPQHPSTSARRRNGRSRSPLTVARQSGRVAVDRRRWWRIRRAGSIRSTPSARRGDSAGLRHRARDDVARSLRRTRRARRLRPDRCRDRSRARGARAVVPAHPHSSRDGAYLSYGRTTYRVPADLAGYLRVRDGGCRFPGCGRRAVASDIDHTVDWARDGHTEHDNLAHLCRKHHRLKHRTGWRMTKDPAASFVGIPRRSRLPKSARASVRSSTATRPCAPGPRRIPGRRSPGRGSA